MAGNFDLGDYIQVPERLAAFYKEYPDGRVASSPPVVVEITGTVGPDEDGNFHEKRQTYIQVTTTVWRTADDTTPCSASAWELFPGKTQYTKESEMMNAETSAVGRALWAVGIEAKRGAASFEDVRKARAVDDHDARPAPRSEGDWTPDHEQRYKDVIARIAALKAEPRGEPYFEMLLAAAKEHGHDKLSLWAGKTEGLPVVEELTTDYEAAVAALKAQDAAEAPQVPDKPKRTTKKATVGSAVTEEAVDKVKGAFPGAEEVSE